MTFRVDEAERDFIRKKMKAAGLENLRVYLLKMAVMGEIVNVDMTEVQECNKLLRNLTNNVNQLTKRANSGGNVYEIDLKDIHNQLEKVWEQQDKILKSLTKIVEAA